MLLSHHGHQEMARRVVAAKALKLVLSRGFAPRTSGFANRRAELITP